jgi:hypothetical protein
MAWTSVLNATSGNSSALSVDFRWGHPIGVHVTVATSGSSGDFVVQFTMDDPTLAGSSAVTWFSGSALTFGLTGASSAVTSSNGYGAIHFQSSVIDTSAGLSLPLVFPVQAVRLASTATSTSLTLRVIQPS